MSRRRRAPPRRRGGVISRPIEQHHVAQSRSRKTRSASFAVTACHSESAVDAAEVLARSYVLAQVCDRAGVRENRSRPFVISRSRVQLPPPAPPFSAHFHVIAISAATVLLPSQTFAALRMASRRSMKRSPTRRNPLRAAGERCRRLRVSESGPDVCDRPQGPRPQVIE